MFRTISRSLSVLVVLVTAWKAWPILLGEWYVVLVVLPILAIIWFPDWVDELAFGTTQHGFTIDSHTPPILVSAAGWVLLLLYCCSVAAPTFWCRLFGVC